MPLIKSAGREVTHACIMQFTVLYVKKYTKPVDERNMQALLRWYFVAICALTMQTLKKTFCAVCQFCTKGQFGSSQSWLECNPPRTANLPRILTANSKHSAPIWPQCAHAA